MARTDAARVNLYSVSRDVNQVTQVASSFVCLQLPLFRTKETPILWMSNMFDRWKHAGRDGSKSPVCTLQAAPVQDRSAAVAADAERQADHARYAMPCYALHGDSPLFSPAVFSKLPFICWPLPSPLSLPLLHTSLHLSGQTIKCDLQKNEW